MKPLYCPVCKGSTFIVYEDLDETFLLCTNIECGWDARIHVIPETTKKGGE